MLNPITIGAGLFGFFRKGGWALLVLAGLIWLGFQAFSYVGNLNTQIDEERAAKQRYKSQLDSISVYNAALRDTLKQIAEHQLLPETLEVKIPVPQFKPPPDSSKSDDKPYAIFYTEYQWDKWLDEYCAPGLIKIDTSTTWENGLGARVSGEFYYGYGVDYSSLDWLNILPIGSYSIPEPERVWPRRAVSLTYATDNEFIFSGSIYSRRGWLVMPGIGYKGEIIGTVSILKLW